MVEEELRSGRSSMAMHIAQIYAVPVIGNDAINWASCELMRSARIEAFETVRLTTDEVAADLGHASGGDDTFVASSDHLARPERVALGADGTNCVFTSSDGPLSEKCAARVFLTEPRHLNMEVSVSYL